MSTYKELIYMTLDLAKGISDDFSLTEDHIRFLLSKYRSLLLTKTYNDIKKQIPLSNYQTVCLLLELYNDSINNSCGETLLRSTTKIPNLLPIGNPIVYPTDYYEGTNILIVSRERMRFVGNNKFLQNIIYCSIGPDNYLYLKSANPLFLYLSSLSFSGIFEDSEDLNNTNCGDLQCDILDRDFPIEESLIPSLIELVLKDVLGVAYRPQDSLNNARDELSYVGMQLSNDLK